MVTPAMPTAWCAHCDRLLDRDALTGEWVHWSTGLPECLAQIPSMEPAPEGQA